MAIEITAEDFECLVQYLLKELKLEALYALRNIIILLKAALEAYITLYIIGSIDKIIEKALLGLRFDNEVASIINNIIRQVNDIKRLLPADRLAECKGLNDILTRVEGTVDMLLGAAAFGASYTNRHKIVEIIEGSRDLLISELISYLDIFLSVVDQAIATWGV